MKLLRLLPLALLFPGALAAQRVTVETGNVVYHASATSTPRRLTALGLDSEPRLSPDGRLVAFVRATPRDSVDAAMGRTEATSLWIVGVDGSAPRLLVRGRASAEPKEALANFQAPRFSPDGRRIYFLSSAWATSGAVHEVDVQSGSERFVVAGNSLEVIPAGAYAGHLLVEQHRYFLGGGSYDWTWLFAPDGAEVGPVGETDGAAAEFLASQGGAR